MENRTRKELLIILRDYAYVKNYCFGLFQEIEYGLCYEIYELYYNDKIYRSEREVLLAHIKNYRPNWVLNRKYGWRPGAWKPRLKWLNKEIERLP